MLNRERTGNGSAAAVVLMTPVYAGKFLLHFIVLRGVIQASRADLDSCLCKNIDVLMSWDDVLQETS